MLMKHTNHLFLLLLALRSGLASSRFIGSRQPNISAAPPPTINMGSDQKLQATNNNKDHISDFTDPDTGLNPFIDVQEGKTGAFERRFKEKDRPLPKQYAPPVTFDDDIVEGDPELPRSRVAVSEERNRGNPRFRSRPSSNRDDHHNRHNSPKTVSTFSPQVLSPINNNGWANPSRKSSFDRIAETISSKNSEADASQEHSTSSTSPTDTVTEWSQPDTTGSSEFAEAPSPMTSAPENPLADAVTSSSALTVIGSMVAITTLVVVLVAALICACKRLRNRRRSNVTAASDTAAAAAAFVEPRNREGNTGYTPSSSSNGRDMKARN